MANFIVTTERDEQPWAEDDCTGVKNAQGRARQMREKLIAEGAKTGRVEITLEDDNQPREAWTPKGGRWVKDRQPSKKRQEQYIG